MESCKEEINDCSNCIFTLSIFLHRTVDDSTEGNYVCVATNKFASLESEAVVTGLGEWYDCGYLPSVIEIFTIS